MDESKHVLPVSKPNAWVTVRDDSTTQLTYALQLDPAPLTVNLPNADPVLTSFRFVITNQLSTDVQVTSIAFTFQIGKGAAALTARPSSEIEWVVSDSVNWQVTPPPGPVTGGPAVFMLGPAAGPSVNIAAGSSVTVRFYEVAANLAVGTTAVSVKEIADGQVGFNSFGVTKFPHGFYFEGLAANVPSGSSYVPVAQVAYNTPVTLFWNGSVVDPSAYTIFYATNEGQQQSTVTKLGEWVSPTLKRDTVFTVLVHATRTGGQPISVALSTAVAVQLPDVFASSLSVAGVTVSGGGALLVPSGGSLAVEGETSLNNANVEGPVAIRGGDLSLDGNARLNGDVTLNGGLTLNGGATLNGDSTLNGVLRGNSSIGGSAARIAGYGTASDAVFALKFDNRNLGNTEKAIQIWNESSGVYKTFIIDHPLDREKYLVHATLEGPEAAVFYRGSAQLESGRAEIRLPAYFEALTSPESWTIQLTNVGGFDRLAVQPDGGRKINGGRFLVISDNPASTQAFDWEVKGARRDQQPLEVEPAKRELLVHAFGPYTYGLRPEQPDEPSGNGSRRENVSHIP